MWSASVTGSLNMAMGLLPVGQSFQCVENAVRARIDRNGGEIAPENHPIPVEHEQGALAHPLAIPIGPVLLCHRAFGLEIGQQREMQVARLCECLMAPCAINRNPQQLGAMLVKLRKDFIV